MKAVIIKGVNSPDIQNVPKPRIGSNELLVRVKAVGICQTDLEILERTHPFTKKLFEEDKDFSLIPGHEWSGVVVKVGKNCKNVTVGDRVVSETTVPCGRCYYCVNNRSNLCEYLEEVGITRAGAMAEYISIPCNIAHKIPDDISFKEAALIEPTAIAIHAVNRIFDKQEEMRDALTGKNVAVFGDGPIGLLVMQIVKNKNPSKIYLIGKSDKKLSIAKKLGCDLCINTGDSLKKESIDIIKKKLNGGEIDIVIEAVGGDEVINEAIGVVRKGGIIIFIGLHNVSPVDMGSLVFKELDFRGTLSSPGVWSDAIRLVSEGKIKTSDLITHEFSLDQAIEAFEHVRKRKQEIIKAIIYLT